MSNRQEDFNEAMERFNDAEAALRAVMDSATELRTAGDELNETRTQLEETVNDSVTRLDNAERNVADTSSAIYRLTEALKDPARDLGDTARALTALNPESIVQDIASIRETHERLSERVGALSEAHETASKERAEDRETHERLSERVDALSEAHETASKERAEDREILKGLRIGVNGCIVLILVAALLVLLL